MAGAPSINEVAATPVLKVRRVTLVPLRTGGECGLRFIVFLPVQMRASTGLPPLFFGFGLRCNGSIARNVALRHSPRRTRGRA
jgi:hypothetical protein